MTDATDILYAYDLLGRLATVTAVKLDGQTLLTPLVTTYHYDADNNLVETDLPNTTVETRQYDALDRLVFLQNTGPGGSVISSYHYTLGPDGTRWAVTENTGRYVAYTYDADNRLTGEVYDHTLQGQHVRDIAWTYTYDLAGNRVAQTGQTPADSGPVTLVYTYDANDRLVSESGEVPSADPTSSSITFINATYTYDAAGNTLTVSGTGVDQATYTYDAAGRMATATVTDHTTDVTHQSSYSYDDAGNRVSQTVDGLTTTYLNDPNQAYDQVLEEYAPGGVLAATYVQGYDLLFQDRTAAGGGAGLSFYAKDGLGSTRALTNVAGAVTDTYTYDAFGNLTASTGTTTNEFLYAGYQADAATGLDYLRARYLDAAVGSFTSRDSYDGETDKPITQNHYLYANADPVNSIDPSGHESVGEVMTTTGITTTIVSANASTVAGTSVTALASIQAYALNSTLWLALNWEGLLFGFEFSVAAIGFAIGVTAEMTEFLDRGIAALVNNEAPIPGGPSASNVGKGFMEPKFKAQATAYVGIDATVNEPGGKVGIVSLGSKSTRADVSDDLYIARVIGELEDKARKISTNRVYTTGKGIGPDTLHPEQIGSRAAVVAINEDRARILVNPSFANALISLQQRIRNVRLVVVPIRGWRSR